jgi:hypothetical protein
VSEAALAEALVAALTDLTVIHKGRTANAGSYSYDYADLADTVEATRKALSAHGLVALTPVHAHDNGLACTVKLIHVSGATLDFPPLSFPPGRDAQATGSAITYHRRYALQAALGIATTDDDDGHKATQSARQPAGMGAGAAKSKLLEHLTGKVPDPVKDHAAAVWTEAAPTAPLSDADLAALLKVADDYVADLDAMAEQPELVP